MAAPKNISKAAEGLLYMKHSEPLYKIERIIEKFMGADGRMYFRVEWEDGTFTDEPRDNLIKEVRGMVQQFERANPLKGGKSRRRYNNTRRKVRKTQRTYKKK